MKVGPDCVVTMKYVMRSHFEDGTVKERPEEVMEFVFGVERQAPTLEKALENAKVDDRLNVRIPASEIYGERDPELIREIPKDGLIKQRVKPGRYYRQMKKGCLVSFKVLEVRPDTVLADFNEPMAGIAVSMEVEILDVRAASREEIKSARDAYLKKRIGCG